MSKKELIDLLNEDIRNEYMHMHFYLHSAIVIQGMHREEYRELLLKEAASEMTHVQEFGDLIVGLGGQPLSAPNPFPTDLVCAKDILHHALKIEDEVVANYVTRMDQATQLGGVDGRWVEIFLEDQIMHSRKDADNLRQILKGGLTCVQSSAL